MPKIVIGMGSNSDHTNNIKQALNNLQQEFGELLVSPVYKSAPRLSQNNETAQLLNDKNYYLNLVVCVDSALSAENIKSCLRAIEQKQMRERNTGIVTIDLDLLLYGSWVGQFDGNNIPHEDIELCEFVLRPLTDLLPNDRHPVKGNCYQELWASFKPNLVLTPVDID
jgi:2-amino-4-hydroxy-6-hydroxymethyldihydropteridine diphosphokinase